MESRFNFGINFSKNQISWIKNWKYYNFFKIEIQCKTHPSFFCCIASTSHLKKVQNHLLNKYKKINTNINRCYKINIKITNCYNKKGTFPCSVGSSANEFFSWMSLTPFSSLIPVATITCDPFVSEE